MGRLGTYPPGDTHRRRAPALLRQRPAANKALHTTQRQSLAIADTRTTKGDQMARIRTIKPEFFTSPDTAKASTDARLFYIALWCWADDWGIGEANLNALLGFAFPEDDEKTRKEIQSLCKEVSAAYGTMFYTNNGRHFYQILSWDEHQKTQRRAQRRNPSHDDPNSLPDKRIYGEHAGSEHLQGNSESTQGNDGDGTGEHRNIGTGEHRNRGTAQVPAGTLHPAENEIPEVEIVEDTPAPADDTEDEPERADVEAVLDALDDHCRAHDFKLPTRSKANRSAARLLLDRDGYSVQQVVWIIQWVSNDDFWPDKIKSATKLRKQFDQLKFQAQRKHQKTAAPGKVTPTERARNTLEMGARLQAEYEEQQQAALNVYALPRRAN